MKWRKSHKWILANESKIVDTTSERQSQNGLVKRTRISTPETSHSYPKERKIPRDYWYYVIYHFTKILNICVGKMNRRLITPHELLYGDKTDAQTWFPLLYVGYLHHQRDGTVTRSSTHYQTCRHHNRTSHKIQCNKLLQPGNKYHIHHWILRPQPGMTHQHPFLTNLWQSNLYGDLQIILGYGTWTLTYKNKGPLPPYKLRTIPGNSLLNTPPPPPCTQTQ